MTLVSIEQGLKLLRVRLWAGEGSIRIPYSTFRPSVWALQLILVFRTKTGRKLSGQTPVWPSRHAPLPGLTGQRGGAPPPAKTFPTGAKRLDPLPCLSPCKNRSSEKAGSTFQCFILMFCTAIFYNALMQFRHSQTLSPE